MISLYGGTEFGAPVCFRDGSGDKDWEYVSFPQLVNTRWGDQGDGTYELQFLVRFYSESLQCLTPVIQKCDTHDPAVDNISGVKGYATSDLFVPHPTKPGFWKM